MSEIGIIEALKATPGMRLSTDTGWLVWNQSFLKYVVYAEMPRGGSRELIRTESESEAVRVLLGEE